LTDAPATDLQGVETSPVPPAAQPSGRADDPLRREGVVLSTAEIQKLIPHRWPFLLVDRVVEYDPAGSFIRAEKAVTATEWFFQGHFPGLPVMPGVLQVEALAQTMAVYVAQQEGFGDRIGLFAGIDDCRFKRVVQPGDRLTLEVTMDKLGRRFGRGKAVASVDGEVCCEATISFVIPNEGALR
jgi:3-hydroxyacyl-[acyl-carrier-protein] dehydratase